MSIKNYRYFTKISIISTFLIVLSFLLITAPVNADQDIEKYLRDWNEKISLAREYLTKAENYLKEGNPKQACIVQKKASNYALKAFDSLQIAFLKSGKQINQVDISLTLRKWQSIGEKCM